jgi:PKD repeat protein
MAGLALAGCAIDDAEPPSLIGPSELGMAVTLFANPDVLTQDGRSQSLIVVEIRDANGRPQRDVPVRAEITVGGFFADFGRLSSRNVVTGSDGRALITYTAPPPPVEAVDPGLFVTILVTPVGTDFRADLARQLDIRLVPPGVLLPPNGAPEARFTVAQPATEGVPVRFDGSTSTDSDGVIVRWDWDFGDGSRGTGAQVSHTYARGGSYSVVLTVTDDRGLRATATQVVAVETPVNPSASFTISPTNPTTSDTVFFNASASQAAPGRQIASYAWTFGDGGVGTGVTTSNRYRGPGTYAVTLTVTDDQGRTGTSSQTINVSAPTRPTAAFTFSPTRPAVGQQVNFDGTLSVAPPGRTIVAWEWNMGDTTIKTGSRVSHVYQNPGTGNVVLTVTDSFGERATTSQQVIIDPTASQNPTASFTVSPSPARIGDLVVVDATASTAANGATIVSYEWAFGDSPGLDSSTAVRNNHTYQTAGTFTITLSVVDNFGRRGTTTRALVVTSTP